MADTSSLMVIDGVSDIQMATLVVAALAAIASVIGGVLVTLLSRRSEKETWLRDLRIRVYGKCMEEAEAYFYGVFWPAKLELADEKDAVANTRARILQLHFRPTMSALSDIVTFGADEVQAAAVEVLQRFGSAVDLAKDTATTSSELGGQLATSESTTGQTCLGLNPAPLAPNRPTDPAYRDTDDNLRPA